MTSFVRLKRTNWTSQNKIF